MCLDCSDFTDEAWDAMAAEAKDWATITFAAGAEVWPEP